MPLLTAGIEVLAFLTGDKVPEAGLRFSKGTAPVSFIVGPRDARAVISRRNERSRRSLWLTFLREGINWKPRERNWGRQNSRK
jgi:hypothetical protein